MRKLVFIVGLYLLSAACFGMSSTTNSPLFTLDTVPPELELISSNGGEEWYSGDTKNILWEASDTNLIVDSICIWYTLNPEDGYVTLVEGIKNSGVYPWLLPNETTHRGRVKVMAVDRLGNISEAISESPFSIIYDPPRSPSNVNINLNNNVDAVITWDPVTETINGTPIMPDGYLVLCSESAYENDEEFYNLLWDVREGTSFTHSDVLLHHNRMFYRVVAYKDYDGSLRSFLSEFKANPEMQVSYRELKEKVRGGVR